MNGETLYFFQGSEHRRDVPAASKRRAWAILMPSPFPHREHEHLTNPPLTQVLFQINFSPIFKITKEEPSEFQERIRERFSKTQLLDPASQSIPMSFVGSKAYRFQTSDDKHAITLAAEYCAISSRRYDGWKSFWRDLNLMHSTLKEVYEPAALTRIGIRYINALTPDNTKSENMNDLMELLSADLKPLFRAGMRINSTESFVQLGVPDDGATLVLRLAARPSQQILLVDLDCYEQRDLALDEVPDWASKRHEFIYDAFRWCLSD